MKILGIESSCDETAASVVEDGRKVLSNVIASQVEEHKIYGGVVPEIASRRHTEAICGVVQKALDDAGCTLNDIDAIGVTYAPGLIGALLVGVNYAKGVSLSAGIPLVPVHHLRGHVAANYISDEEIKPPFLSLVVSGGHTHIINVKSYTEFEVIGRTRDDAAGEAMDKAARTVGLPYPGGVNLDKISKHADENKYKFPVPKIADSKYDFSFSGLKTFAVNLVHNASQKGETVKPEDLGASFIKAVTDLLVSHTMLAAEDTGAKTLVLAGGVSANSRLRKVMQEACDKRNIKLYMPDLKYCGDNAAMIASQGYYEYLDGKRADLTLNAVASMPIDNS
ncbi:MAG: tRNA (adenosine(37)-N6)-threonylcarbamoyltransferase complex transferase subunit TsaD [Ruminococcaceae bacterium]|nr:tRNA (adenosine(37)-N6)-threonylcarbamoyltransferase complex transferase subunit TsaD [Oscillospiraceae bacterium]